jgi:hypothetical protein
LAIKWKHNGRKAGKDFNQHDHSGKIEIKHLSPFIDTNMSFRFKCRKNWDRTGAERDT